MHKKVKVEMITDDLELCEILQFEVNVQYCSVVKCSVFHRLNVKKIIRKSSRAL